MTEYLEFESRPGLKLPGYKTSLLDLKNKQKQNKTVSLLKNAVEDA